MNANRLLKWFKDPPPSHLFEISEAGIAFAHGGKTGFEALEPGALVVSPVHDNVQQPEAVAAAIARISPLNGARKRRPAAVILPDYAARVAVLDFDSFPAAVEEQRALVRFRMKKGLPFDIDSAALSYWVQPGGRKNKVEVLAVTVALEIIARYEALFRNAGYHPGAITTSALAMLNLYHVQGVSVVVKLGGPALAVMVIENSMVKLIRTVSLERIDDEEILAVLKPTLAYVEDELGTSAERLALCGFPANPSWLREVRLAAEPVRSRHGTPGPYDAGLLGYMRAAS